MANGIITSANTIKGICRARDDCAWSNKAVRENRTWLMMDQTGLLDGSQSGSFVGSWASILLLLNPNELPGLLVDFTARMRCLSGKCAQCVRLSTKAGGTNGHFGLAPYHSQRDGTPLDRIHQYRNANACNPLIFKETACLY